MQYTFQKQNTVGKIYENWFCALLDEKKIKWTPNPYNGTNDPRRADYDVILQDKWLAEIKGNPAAERTHNIAIETSILQDSKAHLFVIYYPALFTCWDARVLQRYEIAELLSKKWIVRPAGQYLRPSALIPVEEFKKWGTLLMSFVT